MKKTFTHPFHNTSTTLNVTDGAFLSDSQKAKLERVLCGMPDCRCDFYPVASDDGHWQIHKSGEVEADEAAKAAIALGSIGGKSTSEAKSAAARANGRKGGRPRKNPK